MSTDLEFFFDPICPFAWITSRWVHEVIDLRGIEVEWRFISLAIINEGSDYSKFPPGYPALHAAGRRLLRVAAAARVAGGNDAVDRLYTAAGQTLHVDGLSMRVFGGEEVPATLVTDILTRAGLDTSLAAAADDESFDEVLRAETELAFSRTGRDVGTPIITYSPGTEREASLFGPVISQTPRGDEALELFDAVWTVARTKSFSELKRSDRAPLSFD